MSNREIWVIHNLTSQAVEIDGAGVISGGSSRAVEGIVSRERIAQSAYVLSLLEADNISIELQVDGATTETVTSANALTALLPARKADVEAGGVTSVAGKSGVVTLDTDDIDGLDDALAAKAGATTVTNHISNTSNPHSVTKSQVGLGNVPNTDATQRSNHTGTQAISTVSGLQAALDGKSATNHTHAIATVLNDGFMSSSQAVTVGMIPTYLDGKLSLEGGTMAGSIDMGGNAVYSVEELGVNTIVRGDDMGAITFGSDVNFDSHNIDMNGGVIGTTPQISGYAGVLGLGGNNYVQINENINVVTLGGMNLTTAGGGFDLGGGTITDTVGGQVTFGSDVNMSGSLVSIYELTITDALNANDRPINGVNTVYNWDGYGLDLSNGDTVGLVAGTVAFGPEVTIEADNGTGYLYVQADTLDLTSVGNISATTFNANFAELGGIGIGNNGVEIYGGGSILMNDAFTVQQATLQTTNGTAATIHSTTLAHSQTATIEVIITGVKSDGSSSIGGTMQGVFRRASGGTISQVGVTNTILNTDDDAYDFDFVIDNTAHTVKANVTGKASTTINWTATIKTQKSA